MLLLLSYHFDLDIIRVVIIISFIIISFYVVTICFIFDGARLCWGLEVWQISGEVENKRNSGTHEVDVNVDKTYIYIYIIISKYLQFLIDKSNESVVRAR